MLRHMFFCSGRGTVCCCRRELGITLEVEKRKKKTREPTEQLFDEDIAGENDSSGLFQELLLKAVIEEGSIFIHHSRREPAPEFKPHA